MTKTCKYHGKCGGCQTPNLSYEEQLSLKMRKMIGAMGRFCHVDEIVRMDDPYHYRTKVQALFSRVGERAVAGIYQSAGGRAVPARHCLLEDETASHIRRTVERIANELRLTVYSPKTGRGLLRHVLVRVSRATGEASVLLVTGTSPFTKAEEFVTALTRACPRVVTVVQSVNDTDIPLWTGGAETVLYGDGYMEEIIASHRYRVSPASFLQVNPVQTEKLYALAMECAALTRTDRVLDAYCGVGTMSLLAADRARSVIGVEISESAVADARQNAALNGAKNVRFIAADAGEYMKELLSVRERPNVVIADPPRAGLSRAFLQSLIRLSPERIVYVSCNPDTLARDTGMLVRRGYRAERVIPVDMFPYTTHVESVCLLVKNKKE